MPKLLEGDAPHRETEATIAVVRVDRAISEVQAVGAAGIVDSTQPIVAVGSRTAESTTTDVARVDVVVWRTSNLSAAARAISNPF